LEAWSTMSAPDERTALTQAYAILQTLATGIADDSDAMSALRGATRQITTAMARATSGEAALNALRADTASALSAVSRSLATRTLTQQTIDDAEHAIFVLLQGFDRQQEQPEKIYVDPTLPAPAHHDGESHECHTLEEAVLAWLHLPEKERAQASIKVNGVNGPLYTAADIDRLHIRAEHQRE
jgi:hypothetical protein